MTALPRSRGLEQAADLPGARLVGQPVVEVAGFERPAGGVLGGRRDEGIGNPGPARTRPKGACAGPSTVAPQWFSNPTTSPRSVSTTIPPIIRED